MNVSVDKFQCPICFTLPEKEIYQCRNGHYFCHNCIAKLEHCPICRVSIEGDRKSRNRALEELLDELSINCPFSDKGCSEQVKRRDATEHRATCKYGKDIPLCKLLCFPDCNFKVNLRTIDKIFTHFESVHGREPFGNHADSAHFFYSDFFYWRHLKICTVPLQLKKPRDKLLFVIKLKEDFVSWLCFDLTMSNNSTTVGALMQIEVSADETPTISWKLPIYSILEFEKHFQNPLVNVHLPSLRKLRRQANVIEYHLNIK